MVATHKDISQNPTISPDVSNLLSKTLLICHDQNWFYILKNKCKEPIWDQWIHGFDSLMWLFQSSVIGNNMLKDKNSDKEEVRF